jgi:hypothetical protein
VTSLASFRTTVSSIIGLDNTPGSAEQLLIDGWVNEAIVQILRRTRLRVAIATLDLTAGAKDYELPPGMMYITQAIDASSRPLERVTVDDINELRRGGPSSGVGLTYCYALNGANMFMIYPTPSFVDRLTYYYVPKPVALSQPNDDPATATLGGIPSEYHRAIELYALWRAADYGDDASSQQGDRYQRDFTGEIGQIRRDLQRKGGPRIAPAKLVHAGTRPPRDPSVSRV